LPHIRARTMDPGWHASGTAVRDRGGGETHPESGGKSMFRTSLAAGVLALAGVAWSAPARADTLRLSLPAKGLSAHADVRALPRGATDDDLDAAIFETASRGGGFRGGSFHGGGFRGASFRGGSFHGGGFRGASFRGGSFHGGGFRGVRVGSFHRGSWG